MRLRQSNIRLRQHAEAWDVQRVRRMRSSMGEQMTDDLVKMLREADIYDYNDANELCVKAADRIERLEAALREKDNISYVIDSHGVTHRSFTIVYCAELAGEKKDD